MTSFTKVGEGFQQKADEYATYLGTVEGRLRVDLTARGIEEFLPVPHPTAPVRALDLGGGTGTIAVRLAQRDIQVTLLDSSIAMLEIAERAAREAEVIDRVVLQHGDITLAGKLLTGEQFDVVLCHNVLEYVEDPGAVIADAARLMRRDTPSLLSILVRNRAGEVLKAAIRTGDLEMAERSLTADWGFESLYGGPVRLFTPDELLAMSKAASLELIAERGVRVVADYLPPHVSREADYRRIFDLECKLSRHPEFAAIARYTHCLFRHATGTTEKRV